MEYRELGRTGISVSRICFGGWQASGWSSSSDAGFKATLEHALSQGVNFIDTAESYGNGQSEHLIGQVIRAKRTKVIVASKFSHHHSEPRLIRKSLETSLKRLRTDYIDLYLQHWPPKSPPLSDSIAELEKLKEEGKIRALGVCNWMEPEWRELSDPGRIEVLQPCYNLLWRTIEAHLVTLCQNHSIAVTPYSPLCQGILAGRFRNKEIPPQDFRSKNVYFSESLFPAVGEFVDRLLSLAQNYQKPISAVALRWLLDQPFVTSVIVGASSKEQCNENLQSLSWQLDREHHLKLSELSRSFSLQRQPHDTLWGWHSRESATTHHR